VTQEFAAMNDDAIERIELRISYLERANEDLSEVVLRQEREITALKAQLATLASRMAAGSSEQTEYSPEQERPPHY
jgi:SlyX protein